MILNKRKKIRKKANNKMKILNQNKFKIIFQNHNRSNIRNTWTNFTKMKRKTKPKSTN